MPSGHKRKKSSKQEKEYEEFLFGKDILQKDEVDGKIDPVEYSIDRAGTTVDAKSVSKHAWHDDDDDDIEVDLDQTNRLKKLNKTDENIVSGTTLTALFQERFATKKLKWATATEKEVENSEENGLDLMRQTDSMIDNSSGGRSDLGPLKNGKINIRRMVNANIAEPSKKPISALSFHSSGDLLMTAGHDKVMRFFKIDGDKNEKQLSVKFDMAISSASYLGTSADVIVAGRKPYFYSYDTNSGNLNKIPGPVGRDLQSLEHMYTSKDGSKVAFTGVGGYIHILNGRTKSWMTDLKMNSPVRSVCFVDEFTVATSGLDADIYIWDIRNSGRCVARFPHEDGSCSSFLSSYSPPSLVASSAADPSDRLTLSLIHS
jgi:U3 small nucleolar RNA-associated protein 18